MNIAEGGSGGATRRGHKHSEETKARIRQALLGHKHSAETKAKIGEASKGRIPVFYADTRSKMSAALKGKPSKRKGIPRSAETKQKISESNKGRPFKSRGPMTDETKRRISKAHRRRNVQPM